MSSGKKIADYINVETIDLNLKAKNKNAVIKELFENIGLFSGMNVKYTDEVVY